MIDRFREILNQLSILLGTPLDPDRRGACKLNVHQTLHVQIEYQAEKNRLVFLSFICEVPPGRFRENVLKDALKSNHPRPKSGTLAFSEKKNELALFEFISLELITGQKLLEQLNAFIEKATLWQQAIGNANTSTLVPQPKFPGPGIFGLSHERS